MNHNKLWAIELFCDHGVKLDDVSHNGGMNPLIYAAQRGHNEIAMYLSLRVKDINVEDQETGHNIFSIFMIKRDILRMHQLLMRGADINYLNRKTGMTHLRHAIDEKLPVKVINFLLKSGANPHILDFKDQDSCDVTKHMSMYKKV